ncbi:MAG: type II toxin-antitoxin system RelB/DinJ family antitoxin [Acidipropionibacterium sp.]|jgi:DNA-damage-inducible protein J|nr:type II toxin-antitoxin system RelB/DinJ family antitoxin [Acidipropionibacterium sp.]
MSDTAATRNTASTVQLATRIETSQEQLFRETARRLGTTPADAIRIFVAAFNQHRGFPFDVRLAAEVEPFDTEDDATEFASRMTGKLLDAAR